MLYILVGSCFEDLTRGLFKHTISYNNRINYNPLYNTIDH